MNNLYDIPVGLKIILLHLYIYTLIIIFFKVRWNNIQIDNTGMVKAMRKGGQ